MLDPYDTWLDRAQRDLIATPEARATVRRGDLPAGLAQEPGPAALRKRAGLLWARLAELTDEAPETLPDVEDEVLRKLCADLERRIGEAMGKR